MGEKNSFTVVAFKQMILGQLAIHPTQRSEAGPPSQLLIKINLKEVKNLDVRVYYKTLRRERRWFMT